MIRIGQCGDLHLTEGPRFRDVGTCIDWMIADGAGGYDGRPVDLWIVGGDLVGTTVPHESTVAERNYMDTAFQRMMEIAPVVLVGGNHDFPGDLEGYGRLRGRSPIIVATRPELHVLKVGYRRVFVACLPYVDKALLTDLARGTITDENIAAADTLRAHLARWREEIDATKPDAVVLAAHLTITGAVVAGGEVMSNKEVELTPEDLDRFGADWTALSHIHLFQMIGDRAAYASSIASQRHGEADDKGYLLVDLEAGKLPTVHRRRTPARKLATVRATWEQGADGHFGWVIDGEITPGAEIRVQTSVPEAAASTAPTDDLRAMIQAAGAHKVVVAPQIIPANRVRSEAMAKASTTAERVAAYWDSEGVTPPAADQRARCLARLAELEAEIPQRDAAGSALSGDVLDLHRLTVKGAGWTLPNEVSIDFDALGDGVIAFVSDNGGGKTHLISCAGPATWFNQYPYYDCSFLDHVPDGMRDAVTDLEWSNGPDRYRARLKADRAFGGKKGKVEPQLWRNGEAIEGTGKWGGYSAEIAKIVPPLDLLKVSVFSSQGGDRDFMDLPKAERKDFFIRMLRLDYLQDQAEAARAKANEASLALGPIRESIARLTAQVELAEGLRAGVELRDAIRAHVEQLVSETETDLLTIRAAYEAATETLSRAEGRASAIVERRKALEQTRIAVSKEREAAAIRMTIARAALAGRDEVRAAVAELGALPALEQSLRACRDESESNRSKLAVEHTTAMHRLEQVSGAVDLAREDLATAEAAETRRTERVALAAQIERADARLADAAAWLEIASEDLERHDSDIQRFQKLGAEYATLSAELRAYEAQSSAGEGVDLGNPMCVACPLTSAAVEARRKAERARAAIAALPAEAQTASDEAERIRVTRKALADRIARAIEKRDAIQREANDSRTRLVAIDAALANAKDAALCRAALATTEVGRTAAQANLAAVAVAFKEAVADVALCDGWLTAIARRRDALQPQAAKADAIARADRDLEEALRDEAMAAGRIAEIDRELASEALRIPDLEAIRLVVEERRAALQTATAVHDQHATELIAIDREIAATRAQLRSIDGVEAELAEARAKETSAILDVSDWEELEKALGRDGAQALCLDQAGPVISRICNDLLHSAFGSRFSIDLVTSVAKADGKGTKEVFEVRLWDAEAGKMIEKGSGGEMALVNEGIRLAIAIFNSRMTNVRMRTLYRDETAEGLSERCQDGYVQMLQRARELGGFRRVLLIAHSSRIWRQADAHVFVAPAKGDRPARLFNREADYLAWMEESAGGSTTIDLQSQAAS